MLVVSVGLFFTYITPDEGAAITQAPQITEEEVLESVASDYYSEELAMMDYYDYLQY